MSANEGKNLRINKKGNGLIRNLAFDEKKFGY
jgi:hypothetical protein